MFETGDKPGQDKLDKLKEVLGWLETFVADGKFSAGTDCITVGALALLATYSTMKAAELADLDLSSFPNWSFRHASGLSSPMILAMLSSTSQTAFGTLAS